MGCNKALALTSNARAQGTQPIAKDGSSRIMQTRFCPLHHANSASSHSAKELLLHLELRETGFNKRFIGKRFSNKSLHGWIAHSQHGSTLYVLRNDQGTYLECFL